MIERAFAAHRRNPIIQNIYDTRRLLNAIPQWIEVISRTVHSSAQGAEHTCARKLGPSHPVAMQNHSHSPLRLLQLRGVVFSPPTNMEISLPILMLGPRLLRRAEGETVDAPPAVPAFSFMSFAADTGTMSPFAKLTPEVVEFGHALPATDTEGADGGDTGKSGIGDHVSFTGRKHSWAQLAGENG